MVNLLLEVVTIDLHYMTDRQERFDLKISKLKWVIHLVNYLLNLFNNVDCNLLPRFY